MQKLLREALSQCGSDTGLNKAAQLLLYCIVMRSHLPRRMSREDSVELNTAQVQIVSNSLQILALRQHRFVGFPEEPFRAPELWLRGRID